MEKLQNDFINRRIDLRAFLGAAAAAGVVPLTVPMSKGARAAAADDMTYLTWSGYEVPELHEPYIAEHGGSPN